jgi:hypothetical protein
MLALELSCPVVFLFSNFLDKKEKKAIAAHSLCHGVLEITISHKHA